MALKLVLTRQQTEKDGSECTRRQVKCHGLHHQILPSLLKSGPAVVNTNPFTLGSTRNCEREMRENIVYAQVVQGDAMEDKE